MATSEVISYLTSPPDEQLFFRLQEIFFVIKDKCEQRIFAPAQAQDLEEAQRLPQEIENLMLSLWQLASTQFFIVAKVLQTTKEFVDKLAILFVGISPLTTSNPALLGRIDRARKASGKMAVCWEEAEKKMELFSDRITTTLKKLRAVLDEDKGRGSLATVLTETDFQAVNELSGVAKEACTILRKTGGYLRGIEQDFQAEKLIGLELLPGEIETIKERWETFSKSMNTLDCIAYKETIDKAMSFVMDSADLLSWIEYLVDCIQTSLPKVV